MCFIFYFEFLKKQARAHRQIKFLVNPPDPVLKDYLENSQIYASASRWEALGLTFLEASLFGLPTLGFSSFGPASEVIIDGQTGFLASDLEDFRNKLGNLIVNSDLRIKLGENGRKFAVGFTWEKTARRYLEVFKSENLSI